MSFSFKNLYVYFYMALMVISFIFFLITFNDLITGNMAIENSGLSLVSIGNWQYWVFALSFIGFFVFLYYSYAWIRDDNFFRKNINSESKANFIKNLRKLERIARKHGKNYEEMIKERKAYWKIR
ncbi:DUF3198 domain-containing protein [Caldiplasma sukawensis]